MSGPLEPAGRRYLRTVTDLIARLLDQEWPRIAAAADLMTDAIASGHVIHAFGSGHSHMLAEELFYRAGGLVRVRPILFEGLMLHASAPLSTTLKLSLFSKIASFNTATVTVWLTTPAAKFSVPPATV